MMKNIACVYRLFHPAQLLISSKATLSFQMPPPGAGTAKGRLGGLVQEEKLNKKVSFLSFSRSHLISAFIRLAKERKIFAKQLRLK